MGDPVGESEEARRELVWTFRDQCERAGGWPLFYQVRPEDLDLYLEVGMNLLKIGEETYLARVTAAMSAFCTASPDRCRYTATRLRSARTSRVVSPRAPGGLPAPGTRWPSRTCWLPAMAWKISPIAGLVF